MSVIVFLTENTEGRAALQWALDNGAGDELHLVCPDGSIWWTGPP